eukprot:3587505-Rhodomonas_salina.1
MAPDSEQRELHGDDADASLACGGLGGIFAFALRVLVLGTRHAEHAPDKPLHRPALLPGFGRWQRVRALGELVDLYRPPRKTYGSEPGPRERRAVQRERLAVRRRCCIPDNLMERKEDRQGGRRGEKRGGGGGVLGRADGKTKEVAGWEVRGVEGGLTPFLDKKTEGACLMQEKKRQAKAGTRQAV